MSGKSVDELIRKFETKAKQSPHGERDPIKTGAKVKEKIEALEKMIQRNKEENKRLEEENKRLEEEKKRQEKQLEKIKDLFRESSACERASDCTISLRL